MATIEKRGPYQWRAKVRKKGYKTISKTFDYKEDAVAWARAKEREMDTGEFLPSDGSNEMTLKEAIERYRLEKIPLLADSEREDRRAKALKRRDFGQLHLNKVRVKDIADFIHEREREGTGPNTIRLDLALLSRVFEVAAHTWGMENLRNPVKRVERPRLQSGRTRRLENNEEERLLKAAHPKLQPVIEFALETAMRRGEIAGLTWNQIDFKRRQAHLPKTKNGEARSVPLSPAAIEVLKGLTRNITGSVFGMSGGAIAQAMRKACKNAKPVIKDLRFHDLRHEAISRFFENTDLDAMEIKSISGHKSMQMLARYSHLRTHRLADRLAGKKRLSEETSG